MSHHDRITDYRCREAVIFSVIEEPHGALLEKRCLFLVNSVDRGIEEKVVH